MITLCNTGEEKKKLLDHEKTQSEIQLWFMERETTRDG